VASPDWPGAEAVGRFREPQVVLFSADLPRAVAFYEALGFAEVFRTPASGEPIHVDLALDAYRIGIASVDSTRTDHGLEPVPAGQRAAVILWTDDVSSGYAELVASGVRGLREPHQWLGRLLIAWLEDRTATRSRSSNRCQADGIASWATDVVARVEEVTP